jgi:hypothetical protein
MNLKNWKYVAPVNVNGKPTGSAASYTPARYIKPYFTKTSFVCPVPNAKDGKSFGVYATSDNRGDYAIDIIEDPIIKH